MGIIFGIIHWVLQALIVVVVIQAILTFFMDPYHPVRRTLDQIVNPFLNPIRRLVPPIRNLDFSPLILIILLQVLDGILRRLLYSFS
jgi:YggT family protein